MTLMTGWISGGAACVLCDTAVTAFAAVGESESVFGEPSLRTGMGHVYEGCAKLMAFGDVIVGLIGSMQEATAFARWVSPSLGHPDMRRLVCLAATNLKTARGRTFELLIARRHAGTPEIWRFRSSKEYISRVPARCVLGSAAHHAGFRELVTVAVKSASSATSFNDDQLALCTATLQGVGQVVRLFDFGVGGSFYGAYVDEGGLHWSSDTVFSCCSRATVAGFRTYDDVSAPLAEDLDIRMVGVAVRDGFVARWSNYGDSGIQMLTPPEVDEVAIKLWENRWLADVRKVATMDGVRYWTFLVADLPGHLTIDTRYGDPAYHVELLEGRVAINAVVGDRLAEILAGDRKYRLISQRYASQDAGEDISSPEGEDAHRDRDAESAKG